MYVYVIADYYAPFRQKVPPPIKLDTGGHMVTGMAELDGNIYATLNLAQTIIVFATRQSFRRLDDISIDKMADPSDMAACPTNGHLFISDWKGHCIWMVKIDISDDHEISDAKPISCVAIPWLEKAEEVGSPRSISVTKDGVVLFVDADSAKGELNIYSPENQEPLAVVNLKDRGMNWVWHAIGSQANTQTILNDGKPANTYIVSHGYQKPGLHRVCEIDENGEILKEFGEQCGNKPGQLCKPGHLAMGVNGFIFVMDDDGVMVLDEELRMQRVLVRCPPEVKRHWPPPRLTYVKETGRLLVAWQCGYIHVYDLLQSSATQIK